MLHILPTVLFTLAISAFVPYFLVYVLQNYMECREIIKISEACPRAEVVEPDLSPCDYITSQRKNHCCLFMRVVISLSYIWLLHVLENISVHRSTDQSRSFKKLRIHKNIVRYNHRRWVASCNHRPSRKVLQIQDPDSSACLCSKCNRQDGQNGPQMPKIPAIAQEPTPKRTNYWL